MALTFTLGVSLLTGLLFGLAPALMATWPQLSETLKDGGKGAGQSGLRNRTRSLLVVFETAIAVTLLTGAGLLVRSYIRLQHVNPGFDATNALTTRTGNQALARRSAARIRWGVVADARDEDFVVWHKRNRSADVRGDRATARGCGAAGLLDSSPSRSAS